MDEERLPAERMRASDADRDAVADRLATALAEGRLDMTEYDDRLSAAMRATTVGDLTQITEDLPATTDPVRGPVDLAEVGTAAAPRRAWRDRLEPWRGFAGISIVLVGVWAVSSVMAGGLLPFWPIWPLSFMLVITAANSIAGSRRRAHDDPEPPRGADGTKSGD